MTAAQMPQQPTRPGVEPKRNPTEDSILPTGGRDQDTERMLRMVEALAPGTGQMKMAVMLGEPPSKSRPRFTRNGKPYRTKEDVDAEERTAWNFRRLFSEPWTGNIALGAVFFRPNKQRIDVDNMLKHVCDAANGIAWVDDSQVTAIYGVAELDVNEPRTLVVVAQHKSSLPRGTNNMRACEYCGKLFPLSGRPDRRFCDLKCVNGARGYDLSEPVPCAQCGELFRRKTSRQVMCSRACHGESLRGRNRARAVEKSKCADCGKVLAHSRGGRCRDCWRTSGAAKATGRAGS